MYRNFEFYTPTKVLFGEGAERRTAAEIRAFGGTKVLVVYGGQSAVRSGLIGRITASLEEAGLPFALLGGVVPNPHLGKVREGIALGRKEGADFLLAVGGGSVIDTVKAIGYGLANEGDVWDFFAHTREASACLPLASVLTIAAAGSEMSCGCVITNEETGEKRAYDSDLSRAKFAVMDPDLTLTLPDYQTFSGIADILMHTMERYFRKDGGMELTDALAEALMRSVMQSARALRADPQSREARAEIMWAGSLSHNGLTGCGTDGGDWASHNMEHELGGMFDVAHGAGLAAIWGSWARYVHAAAPARFVKFAENVLGVQKRADDEETIEAGIRAMERFYREIGMPTSLRELGVAPTDAQIAHMAAGCEAATGGANGRILPLKQEDMEKIYRMAR